MAQERKDLNKHSETGVAGRSFQSRRMATQRQRFLAEMELALPWAELRSLIRPLDADPGRVRGHSLELDRMLRIFFLQHWYHLSDVSMHEALHDSKAMRDFACVGLGAERTPSEHEIAAFRKLLDEHALSGGLVDVVERHMRGEGFAVSPGMVTEAAVVSASGLIAAVWRVLETRQ